MQKSAKIYVAGHRGMVGSAICRLLSKRGFSNILTVTSKDLDLREQQAVRDYFNSEQPEYVFLAAARVGGIQANNDYPADFLYQNLMIEANVIEAAKRVDVKKLLFLGSTCIYPKHAPQPLKEEYLLTAPLEKTNEWYAIAKIAGIKLCQAYRQQYGSNYISAMPTNLYGPDDNYDLESSHVLPALIRKFHDASISNAEAVTIWGTGKPMREFLHVDDCAAACILLMDEYNGSDIVNLGVGKDISIAELAGIVKEVVGYNGKIIYDPSRPDGTPRKLVDISKISDIGWHAGIDLEDGIKSTYQWFIDNAA